MPYELRPATGEYLEQILHETFPIWGDGLSPEGYARYWAAQLQTPWGRAHLDRVAFVDTDARRRSPVIASAKRYDLAARIDGRIRRVLGIGAVFTSPAHRGRGASVALIDRMLEAAETEGYEFAMLFSEIGPALYERLDFVPVPLDESRLRVAIGGGAPAVLVRAGDDRDIPAIAEMGRRCAEGARFALDRSDDFVRYGLSKRRLLAGLGPPGVRQVEFLVAEEAHTAVAYLVVTVEAGGWFIEEAGDRDPSGARVGAMLQTMLAREPGLPPPQIHAWWPHGFEPPQLAIAGRTPTREILMLRPLKDRTLPLPPLGAEEVLYWRTDYF